MNFYDLSAQHIFFRNKLYMIYERFYLSYLSFGQGSSLLWTHTLRPKWMLTRIKIYFQLLVNQSVSETSETTNRMIFTETKILVHFYKQFQNIIIISHDFPWPWLFSMTFQAWKMVLLNSMTFQEECSPWSNVQICTVHAQTETYFTWQCSSTRREIRQVKFRCNQRQQAREFRYLKTAIRRGRLRTNTHNQTMTQKEAF